MTKHTLKYSAALVAILMLMSGCKSTPLVGEATDSIMGFREDAETRLSTAAMQAAAEGKTDEALALYEKLYKDPHGVPGVSAHYRDNSIVLNYAQLLRKAGRAQEALDVLMPVARNRRASSRVATTDPVILNELAAIRIDLGQFDGAEELLNGILEDKTHQGYHADAYNLMGISLDAQGQHKEAEQSFRQALSMWKGDKTSVMNNLAVCLASQGMFDESLLTLRQALIASPNEKPQIAHNIQLVTELMQSLVPQPPKAGTAPATPPKKK